MSNIFLNSYRPLISSEPGRAAIKSYSQLKFVDASNRREPHLEGKYAYVSSLCRANKLVSRLNIGDKIVYITTKGKHLEGTLEEHWCLTAILEIYKIFNSHQEAFQWLKENNLEIPSNCVVEGNMPIDDRLTGGVCPDEREYQRRSTKFPKYFLCKKLFVELNIPPKVKRGDFYEIFGGIPGTENPGVISEEKYNKLLKICKIKI